VHGEKAPDDVDGHKAIDGEVLGEKAPSATEKDADAQGEMAPGVTMNEIPHGW
jgi:hypothetical protein